MGLGGRWDIRLKAGLHVISSNALCDRRTDRDVANAVDKPAEPVAAKPKDPGGPLSPALLKITAVVAFGPFLAQLDTTIVNVALSTLSSELNAPIGTIQWVATGYLLALALMVPLSGWFV